MSDILQIDSKVFLDSLNTFKSVYESYELENSYLIEANKAYCKKKIAYIASIFENNPSLLFATNSANECGLEIILKLGFLDNPENSSEASDFLNNGYNLNPNFNFLPFLLSKKIASYEERLEKSFLNNFSKVLEEFPLSWIIRKDWNTFVLDIEQAALKTKNPAKSFYSLMKSIKKQYKDWNVPHDLISSRVVGADFLPVLVKSDKDLEFMFSNNISFKQHFFQIFLSVDKNNKNKEFFRSLLNEDEQISFDYFSRVSLLKSEDMEKSLIDFFKDSVSLAYKMPNGISFLDFLAKNKSSAFRSYFHSVFYKKRKSDDEINFIKLATTISNFYGLSPVDIACHSLKNIRSDSKPHLTLLSNSTPNVNLGHLFSQYPLAIHSLSLIIKDFNLCDIKIPDNFNVKNKKLFFEQITSLLLTEKTFNSGVSWEINQFCNDLLEFQFPDMYKKYQMVKKIDKEDSLSCFTELKYFFKNSPLNSIINFKEAKVELEEILKQSIPFSFLIKTNVKDAVEYLSINSPFLGDLIYKKPSSIEMLNSLCSFIKEHDEWNELSQGMPLYLKMQELYFQKYTPPFGLFKENDFQIVANNVLPDIRHKLINESKKKYNVYTDNIQESYYLMGLELSSKKWFSNDSESVFSQLVNFSYDFEHKFKLKFLNKSLESPDLSLEQPYLFESFKLPKDLYGEFLKKGMNPHASMKDGKTLKDLIFETNDLSLIESVSNNNSNLFIELLSVEIEDKEPLKKIKDKYTDVLRKYPDYLLLKDSNGLNALMYLAIVCPKLIVQEWELNKDNYESKIIFMNCFNQRDKFDRPIYYYLLNKSNSIVNFIYSKMSLNRDYLTYQEHNEMKLLGLSIDKNSSLIPEYTSPIEIPKIFKNEDNEMKINDILLNELLLSEKIDNIKVDFSTNLSSFSKKIQPALFLLEINNFLYEFKYSSKNEKRKVLFEKKCKNLLDFYSSSVLIHEVNPLFFHALTKINQKINYFSEISLLKNSGYDSTSSVVILFEKISKVLNEYKILESFNEKNKVNHAPPKIRF